MSSIMVGEEEEETRQPADPTKVVCKGAGLRWGYVNLPIRADIDTRNAGPGRHRLCLGDLFNVMALDP